MCSCRAAAAAFIFNFNFIFILIGAQLRTFTQSSITFVSLPPVSAKALYLTFSLIGFTVRVYCTYS